MSKKRFRFPIGVVLRSALPALRTAVARALEATSAASEGGSRITLAEWRAVSAAAAEEIGDALHESYEKWLAKQTDAAR